MGDRKPLSLVISGRPATSSPQPRTNSRDQFKINLRAHNINMGIQRMCEDAYHEQPLIYDPTLSLNPPRGATGAVCYKMWPTRSIGGAYYAAGKKSNRHSSDNVNYCPRFNLDDMCFHFVYGLSSSFQAIIPDDKYLTTTTQRSPSSGCQPLSSLSHGSRCRADVSPLCN